MRPSKEGILGKQNPERRVEILLAHAQKPDGLAVIDLLDGMGLEPKDRAGIQTNHLDKLIELGMLVECSVVPEHGKQKRNRERDAHRLNHDPETFHILVTKAFDHDRDSQTVFMRSQYYQGMIHDLADQFVDSTPKKDRWMLVRPSNDDDIDDDELAVWIMDNVLRENWLALKFVTHFIFATDDERSSILDLLMKTSLNPVISPTAARNAGEKRGFRSGMDACQLFIKDDKQADFIKERIKAEMNNAPFDNYINWTELFAQLHHFNSNYRYLFD